MVVWIDLLSKVHVPVHHFDRLAVDLDVAAPTASVLHRLRLLSVDAESNECAHFVELVEHLLGHLDGCLQGNIYFRSKQIRVKLLASAFYVLSVRQDSSIFGLQRSHHPSLLSELVTALLQRSSIV